MPSDPVNRHDIAVIWPPPRSASTDVRAAIVAALRTMKYDVQDSPSSISAAVLSEGSLVLVDLADQNAEAYLGLGELLGIHSKAPATFLAAAVGATQQNFDWLVLPTTVPFCRYDPADSANIGAAVREAVGRAERSAPPRPSAAGRNAIADVVPRTIRERIPDPLLAMATALYILHMGRITEESLAASIGFPPFPPRRRVVELMRSLFDVEDLNDNDGLPRELFDVLERRLDPTGSSSDDESFGAALLQRANIGSAKPERSGKQTAILLETLWNIAEAAVDEAQDLRYWELGRKAISQIARLVVSQVLPTELRTMERLLKQDPTLRMVATLGGALFLRNSIEILARTDFTGPYTQLGLRLAEITDEWGGRPGIMHAANEGTNLDTYIAGLVQFAEHDDAIFMLEHPFHFRVLLEVLSGENRRYPAEPVLNAEALSRVWESGDLFDTFCWSREQLPVVANVISEPSRTQAYVQHYAAYGRTPLTSSFAHLSYETRSTIRWPPGIPWPAAFTRNGAVSIRNEPNTMAHARVVTQRQFCLSRLWRGVPDEEDLRVLYGELASWDGTPVTDGNLAARICDTATWLGHGLVVDTLAEVRTGAWLLEALRLRLRSMSLPPDWNVNVRDRSDHTNHTMKEIEELRCVLATMRRFAIDYIDGPGDGLTGFKRSMSKLGTKRWFPSEGDLSERFDRFAAMIEEVQGRLAEEVVQARRELARWDEMFGTDDDA